MKNLHTLFINPLKKVAGTAACLSLLTLSATPTTAQIAAGKSKFLGNIIANSVPSTFGTYWNQVTPENSGKWGSVEATRNTMSWGALDAAYNYAQSRGFPFKQHTLVWGSQEPGWMGSLSASAQKAEVEEWIRLFGQRYPNTKFIDVVNEPLHAPASYRNALGGAGATGWDWVIWSFQKARQYCPNAKLLLNDYSILSDNTNTDKYVKLVNLLKSRGLIDGVGEQGHFFETTPLSTLKSNLSKLAATGVPIYISEYDVKFANDTDQLNKYKEQFPIFWTNPAVKGITLWGYIQGQIWRADAYLLRSNGTERPALKWLKTYVRSTSVRLMEDEDESVAGENTPLYPNPAPHGKFTLVLAEETTEVRIADLNGQTIRTVRTQGQQSLSLDLGVAAGVYVVQLVHRDKHSTFKRLVVK